MFLLYIDESGVPNTHPSQTSHYVMIGMAVHVGTWFALSQRVSALKLRYALDGNTDSLELHAAWMIRSLREQTLIPSFDQLSRRARHEAVLRWRDEHKAGEWEAKPKREVDREKKAFRRTEPYVHLTRGERDELYRKALDIVGDHRRGVLLFGEALDKRSLPSGVDPAEEAFGCLIKSFEDFLQEHEENPWGLLVVDNDQTRSARYTEMVRKFQQQDGFRGGIDRIIESPFFLDSRASSGVQVADLCAYALRRYLENEEEELFSIIFPKFYRAGGGLSGLRHFTAPDCGCMICAEPRSARARRPRKKRKKTSETSAASRPGGVAQAGSRRARRPFGV